MSDKLIHKQRFGPAVKYDVVHRKREHVVQGRYSDKERSKGRFVFEVESTHGVLSRERSGSAGRIRVVRDIPHRRRWERMSRNLYWFTTIEGKGRHEHRMPPHNGTDGLVQRSWVEFSAQAQPKRTVVGGFVTCELGGQPQTLLDMGKRGGG